MIHRTFTRPELVQALRDVDRPDIADGLYSRRVEHAETPHAGPRCLALDFDDPGDLAVFVVAVARLLDLEGTVEFAASTDLVLPGHPVEPGPSGARWLGWVLDEPTVEEWTDETNNCPGCCRDEDVDCPYHPHAPWETPRFAYIDQADRHLTAVQ